MISADNVTLAPRELPPLEGGRYVRLRVCDTGVGIPESVLPNIFDPFFTTKQRGSGLGLAISYSIIRRHRGTITVQSQPGQGSTFSLYLPAAEVLPSTPPPTAPPSSHRQRLERVAACW